MTVAEFLHDINGDSYRADFDRVLEGPSGSLVGVCFLERDDDFPSWGHIAALGVRRDARKRGLGSALLSDALQILLNEV